MTHGDEQSDPAKLAVKPTNKSGQPDAKRAEPREGAKGNTIECGMRRLHGLNLAEFQEAEPLGLVRGSRAA